jgi:hypothetical protein
VAALAGGILLSRVVPFESRELVLIVAAYAVLALICLWRRLRPLAGVSGMLAFVAAGALVAITHRTPPAPQLDTEGPAILSGCVVEPSALSAGRDQFWSSSQVPVYG